MENKTKPVCKYGRACYRRNPGHLRQYSHPGREQKESGAAEHGRETRRSKRREGGGGGKRGKTDVSSLASETGREGEHSLDSDEEGVPATKKPKREQSETSETREDSKEVLVPEGDSGGNAAGEKDPSSQSHVDTDELASESEYVRENVKRKFLVEMPDDFYQFWNFCRTLNPAKPELALRPLLGLELVGPYHVLAGRLKGVPWQKCVLHSRYFYDPPEFLTVIRGDESTGFHIGYFRDDPTSVSCILVSNCAKVNCEIKPEGENMFEVIKSHISRQLGDKHLQARQKKQLEELHSKLVTTAGEIGLILADPKSLPAVRRRSKEVVAKTFHKFGIVVPYDKETELGYRPLPVTDRDLRRLLDHISSCSDPAKRDREFEPLQEVITLVQFANDECDYGMGLELGTDLFCHGSHFDHVLKHLFPLAYELLGRDEFARIVREHLKQRCHTPLDFSSLPL